LPSLGNTKGGCATLPAFRNKNLRRRSMRYSNVLSGVGAVILSLSAGMATAGQRDASSKALGDMQGRTLQRQVNRAYSYAPANAVAAPVTAAEQPQATAPATSGQDNSTRSFSYQSAPSNNAVQMNRRATRVPGFFRADRKAKSEY
jgi:hypothetical protein